MSQKPVVPSRGLAGLTSQIPASARHEPGRPVVVSLALDGRAANQFHGSIQVRLEPCADTPTTRRLDLALLRLDPAAVGTVEPERSLQVIPLRSQLNRHGRSRGDRRIGEEGPGVGDRGEAARAVRRGV
jgi:hypothetical protein